MPKRETIHERWAKDIGFGMPTAPDVPPPPGEKAYNPKQPRDPGGEGGGQWVRSPGGSPHLQLSGEARAPGKGSLITSADRKVMTATVNQAVKKFPELKKKSSGKGWKGLPTTPFGGINYMSAQNPLARGIAGEAEQLYAGGQTPGAATEGFHGQSYISVNDLAAAGDGIHTIGNASPPNWLAPGSDTPPGTVRHELGHALEYATGVLNDNMSNEEESQINAELFARHGLTGIAQHWSGYAGTDPTEAFAELFASYMAGRMDVAVVPKFEGLLSEITGRKITS